jgi:hypothetical protein
LGKIALPLFDGADDLVAGAVRTGGHDRDGPDRDCCFASRSHDGAGVANQLQSLGLDAKSATERVAALTDSEVQLLAGKINSMPAGADSTGVLLLLLLVGVAVWWIWFRR